MIEAKSHGRPVYVLGAGFSKAISAAMPVTDELGIVLKRRLEADVVFDLRDDQTFEDWLTLQITPLPFLESFANSRRSADAARVISEIAKVLDERVEDAALSPAPRWLRQLIAVWDAEKAAVLTFNYDTLLERAVNVCLPVAGVRSNNLTALLGEHVVFPAPPAAQAQFRGDEGAPHNAESFQVLKLHGSLSWYWAAGDSSGSTLVRMREKHVLGSPTPLTLDSDFSGATTLDRYLIPPVTSKDGYYGSYLANTLWRSARAVVASASSLTLIGYSLPLEDRVASQLIAEAGSGANINVVDRNPGSKEPREGILGRLDSLGMRADAAASGQDCVSEFVEAKVSAAVKALPGAMAFDELETAYADVVVAIAKAYGSPYPASLFVLVWNDEEQSFQAHPVDRSFMHGSSMPYRDSVHNAMPRGMRKSEDFVTSTRLRQMIADGQPFVFEHPQTRERLVGIAAERIKIERWELLHLKWAPVSA